MERNNHHEFALFYPESAVWDVGGTYPISDEVLAHRIVKVLRLWPGDSVTFFNRVSALESTILEVGKKDLVASPRYRLLLEPLVPSITWLVPLLERDAFEQVLSSLTALGAHCIIPFITSKSRKQMITPHGRIERILIAAAEQSKQFVLPLVQEPISFTEAVTFCTDKEVLLFDPAGHNAFSVLHNLRNSSQNSIVCLIGPEGGLLAEEISQLTQVGVRICALTPSILEAWQAAIVGMGLLRSCLRTDL